VIIMKKLYAIIISLLFIGSTFGIVSVFGAFDVEVKDFIFTEFNTDYGYIEDAESKDGYFADAYDIAFYLYVDGSSYCASGDYTTEAGGREYVLDEETMSGLTVIRKVYFPEDRNWVRYLEILHNPTGSPITVEVEISSDLGSDSCTRVVMTSSGDNVADANDYWATSDEDYGSECICDDPFLSHVWDGPGGADRIDVLAELYNGSDEIEYYWKDVTVNPGQTVVLMHFGGLSTNNNDSISLAQDLYNYKDAKMKYDLQESNQIINWNPAKLGTATGNKSTLPIAQILKIVKENQED
jgi:hypothetical protein